MVTSKTNPYLRWEVVVKHQLVLEKKTDGR